VNGGGRARLAEPPRFSRQGKAAPALVASGIIPNPVNTLHTAFASLILFAVAWPQDPAATPASDEALVRRAALDYVEALYEVKPELIERVLPVRVSDSARAAA
jgi:hypothetical protein